MSGIDQEGSHFLRIIGESSLLITFFLSLSSFFFSRDPPEELLLLDAALGAATSRAFLFCETFLALGCLSTLPDFYEDKLLGVLGLELLLDPDRSLFLFSFFSISFLIRLFLLFPLDSLLWLFSIE